MATTLDTYMPYDAGPGSSVSEDGWRQFAKHWRGDGVMRSGTSGITNSEFAVFGDSTGMQVKVPTGECWIQGNWGKNLSTKTLPVSAAHATLQRLDLAILRNDFVNNRIEIDVKTGTAGLTTFPALTKNSSIWEIQLGGITVPAAAVTITAGNVNSLQTFTDGSCAYEVDASLQSTATGVDTRIDFDLPKFDSSEVGRNGINKFVMNRSGMWLCRQSVCWSGASSAGYRLSWFSRTPTPATRFASDLRVPTQGSTETITQGTSMERFAVGEEISVWGWQGSGGNLSIFQSFNATTIQLYWLGP